MTARCCLFLTACSGFLAVLLGAFGAHGLKDTGYLERKYAEEKPRNIAGQPLPASYKFLADFETGVDYHLTHTFALGLTGVLLLRKPSRWLTLAAWSFLLGIVLFSGALYVLVIAGPQWQGIRWGMIAPIGGTCQLIGWICLAGGVRSVVDTRAGHSCS